MDNKKLTIQKTMGRGKGVFAREKIRKGEKLAEFDGAIYGSNADWDNNYIYNHVIQFSKWKWRGSNGIADQFNHSCDPNCGIRGLFMIVAMRTILPGEELTWDYAMTENYTWHMRCKCGSPICRKNVGAYKDLPKDIRKKYKGYISDWLAKP